MALGSIICQPAVRQISGERLPRRGTIAGAAFNRLCQKWLGSKAGTEDLKKGMLGG